MTLKTLITTLFLHFIVLLSFGQGGHRLNINTGLSNNYIHSLCVDSKGFIWVGTETGLDSYDGTQIKNHAKRFAIPLKGAVQSILEISPQMLLVGTSWGAFQYDIRKNKIHSFDFGTSSIDVREIYKTKNQKIYFISDKGLFELQSDRLKVKQVQLAPNPNEPLLAMKEINNQEFCLIGENHVFKLKSPASISTILTSPSLIKCSYLIDNNLFIGTTKGVYCLNTKTQEFKPLTSLSYLVCSSITCSVSGNLYVGTANEGVFRMQLNTGKIERYSHQPGNPESIVSGSIMSLLIDHNENLWIGTFDGGVDYINLNAHPRFSTYELLGKSNTHIRSIYLDKDGTGYAGTRDGIFCAFNADKKVINKLTSTPAFPFPSQVLTTIFQSPVNPDYLLIGTFGGGIFQVNKRTFKPKDFSKDIVFKHSTVYKFCTDRNNMLWMATLNGLVRYNTLNNTYLKINTEVATGSNEVFTITYNRNDKIWIGTKNGVCIYDITTNKFEQNKVLSNYKYQCSSIFIDSKENKWCCFNKGGVLKLDKSNKPVLWITHEIGIPENAPSSAVEDKDGNIWIGSSKGLYKINLKSDIESYSYEDGLTGLAFTPESTAKDALGNIWWTNDYGLVTYLGNEVRSKIVTPVLSLTDVYINGTRFDADTLNNIDFQSPGKYKITLHGKTSNNLEIRIIAPNYKYPLKSRYAYKTETDKEWIKTGNNNQISLNNLSIGKHHLIVRATDEEGKWIDAEMNIQIIIQPYFYESIWFIVLLVLSGTSVVLYFTRNYTRRMRFKLNEQLEELRKKQTKPAEPAVLKIPEQRAEEIKIRLSNYMVGSKPFLSSELRQADVAKATGFSVHEISQVLNSLLNISFPDYVNSFRVAEIKERMKTDDAKKYTLTAIAMQCGFSGKSSFLRAFRKFTAQTPSEYFKGVQMD
ncbi:MAG: two-component regulator propeller domain-containing protein [Paludibacter sp.]